MEIIILPTIHINKNNDEIVDKAFQIFKPNMVALELCQQRYAAITTNKKPSIFDLLSKPFFSLFYLPQQLLGKILGSSPGLEMVCAIKLAKKNNVPMLLADIPITLTLAALKSVPLSEKIKLFIPIFSKNTISLSSLAELASPAKLKQILAYFEQQAPTTYYHIIRNRDLHMFMSVLHAGRGRVLLIIGAGHATGIAYLIDAYNLNNKTQITYKTLN